MSLCMYKLRPIVNHGETLPSPSHDMYHMKPIHGSERQPRTTTVRLADINDRVQELIQVRGVQTSKGVFLECVGGVDLTSSKDPRVMLLTNLP